MIIRCSNDPKLDPNVRMFFPCEAAENKRDSHRNNCSHIHTHKQKRQTHEWKRSSQNPQHTQGTGGWYSFSFMDMKLKLNTAHTARHGMQKLLLLLMFHANRFESNMIYKLSFVTLQPTSIILTRNSCVETQEAYHPRRNHSLIQSFARLSCTWTVPRSCLGVPHPVQWYPQKVPGNVNWGTRTERDLGPETEVPHSPVDGQTSVKT